MDVMSRGRLVDTGDVDEAEVTRNYSTRHLRRPCMAQGVVFTSSSIRSYQVIIPTIQCEFYLSQAAVHLEHAFCKMSLEGLYFRCKPTGDMRY
jgi:hypothetical protein